VLASFDGVSFVERHNTEGELLAYGWTLDHAYSGAIARSLRLGGIRMRHKNVQVGDAEALAAIFPETRFTQWAVGDMHVAHVRIVPNARRDDFEHTPAHAQLVEELRVVARGITQTIRARSDQRAKLRKVQLQLTYAEQWLEFAEAAKAPVMSVAMVDKAAIHVEESAKALAKLQNAEKQHAVVVDKLRRTKSIVDQKIKGRRKNWAAEGSYAAVFAVLSSSVKPDAVTPLAERVSCCYEDRECALGVRAAEPGSS
jgi:hypothetical protein